MKKYLQLLFVRLIISLFDDTQTTLLSATGNDLSAEMKTWYKTRLIDISTPLLVHNQFGQKQPIPSGSGKTIEFRKYSPLKKALTKLQEGVTPTGNKLDYSVILATVDQYGDFTRISDVLKTTAVDPQIEVATKRHGDQAGRTLDTVTREIITAGSNRIFAPIVSSGSETAVLLRSSITTNAYISSDVLSYAKALLARKNARPIDGSFVCVMHTDIASEYRRETSDGGWLDMHQYAAPENIFSGETGKFDGIRFVETPEAKIIGPADMLGIEGYTRTTLRSATLGSSPDIYPATPFTVAQAAVITAAIAAGTTYTIYVDGTEYTVASVVGGAAGTCKITFTGNVAAADAGDMVCGTGAGKDGSAVYCTMLLGADAYGVTEVSGLGLEHIYKPLGSGEDPLNQRATVGWKATAVAERLVEEFMVRIEHTSKRFRLSAESNLYT